MNNAIFSETTENVQNYVDVKLFTNWEGQYGAEAMIVKPNFHSRSIFSQCLIELRKLEVKFNKPIYVNMFLLNISKICLYEFHEYTLTMHRDKCKIMCTDTESLIYYVECNDVHETMKHYIAKYDVSDYPANNVPLANKTIPSMIKDENNGAISDQIR